MTSPPIERGTEEAVTIRAALDREHWGHLASVLEHGDMQRVADNGCHLCQATLALSSLEATFLRVREERDAAKAWRTEHIGGAAFAALWGRALDGSRPDVPTVIADLREQIERLAA